MFSPDRPSTLPKKVALTGAVATLLLAAAAHAGDTSGKFVLTVYSNGLGGKSLLAGDYAAALEQISRPQGNWLLRDPMTTATNLCVAYTMTLQWDAARAACNEAISEARRAKLREPSWAVGARRKQNDYVALAYSNRAVLRWLSKDPDSAAKDIAAAEALAPEADFVARNRAALNASAAKLVRAEVLPQS